MRAVATTALSALLLLPVLALRQPAPAKDPAPSKGPAPAIEKLTRGARLQQRFMAAVSTDGQGGRNLDLLNPDSLQPEFTYSIYGANYDYASALSFNPVDHQLYAIGLDFGFGKKADPERRLIRINPITGEATYVITEFPDYDDITHDMDGNLYGFRFSQEASIPRKLGIPSASVPRLDLIRTSGPFYFTLFDLTDKFNYGQDFISFNDSDSNIYRLTTFVDDGVVTKGGRTNTHHEYEIMFPSEGSLGNTNAPTDNTDPFGGGNYVQDFTWDDARQKHIFYETDNNFYQEDSSSTLGLINPAQNYYDAIDFVDIPWNCVTTFDTQTSDTLGDLDGALEPGEDGQIALRIYHDNLLPLTNVTASLISTDPPGQVTVYTTGGVTYGDMNPYTIAAPNFPFSIGISPLKSCDDLHFRFFVQSDQVTCEYPITIEMGRTERTLLTEDWETTPSLRWSFSGLAHQATDSLCLSDNGLPVATDGNSVLAFNFEDTCDYTNGNRVTGTATLRNSVFLPSNSDYIVLNFDQLTDVEGNPNFDQLHVQIADVTDAVFQDVYLSGDRYVPWAQSGIDISAYKGKRVKIRFLFDSVDAASNNTLGAFIDRVSIIASSHMCDYGITPTPTPVVTGTPTPTATASPTPIRTTPTASGSFTPTVTPIVTHTLTPTPTFTPTLIVTATPTPIDTHQNFCIDSGTPPAAIPDDGTAGSATLDILNSGTIQDIDVSFRISHTSVGQLTGYLFRSPSGQFVKLFEHIPAGSFKNNKGVLLCDGDNMNVRLDDEAGVSIQDSCTGSDPSVFGTRIPLNTLNGIFAGEDMQGTWILEVTDEFTGETGTIDDFCLHINALVSTPTPSITPTFSPTPTPTFVCPTGFPFSPSSTPTPTVTSTPPPTPVITGPGVISVSTDGVTITADHTGQTIPGKNSYIGFWIRRLNDPSAPTQFLGLVPYNDGETTTTKAWPAGDPQADSRYLLSAQAYVTGQGYTSSSVTNIYTTISLPDSLPIIGSVGYDDGNGEVLVDFSTVGTIPASVGFWYRKIDIPNLSPPRQAGATSGWTYTGLHAVPLLTNEIRIPFDRGTDNYEIASAVYVPGPGFLLPYALGFAPDSGVYPRFTGLAHDTSSGSVTYLFSPVGNMKTDVGFWFREIDPFTCEPLCNWRYMSMSHYVYNSRDFSRTFFPANRFGTYQIAARLYVNDGSFRGWISDYLITRDPCGFRKGLADPEVMIVPPGSPDAPPDPFEKGSGADAPEPAKSEK